MSMKKLAAALAALATLLTMSPAWAEIGRVRNVVGDVQVVRGDRTVAATSGFRLEQGDVVVTGRSGRAGILFLDNTRAAVGPGSRVSLDEFRYDRARQSGSFVTSVYRGSIGVVSGNIARSGRDNMRVRTPTSVLGVRGTRFVVEVG